MKICRIMRSSIILIPWWKQEKHKRHKEINLELWKKKNKKI